MELIMGMFDSFLVAHNDTTHEVQTKRFANNLDSWSVGDVINQPSFGVQVLYELAEEVDGRLEHTFVEDATVIVYLIIVNGVYVESIVEPFQPHDIESRIVELGEGWADANRQITAFATHLNSKQTINKTYRTTFNKLVGYIDAYRNPGKVGTFGFNIEKIHYHKLETVNSDKELIDVLLEEIKEVLEHKNAIEIVYDSDPLAKYRL